MKVALVLCFVVAVATCVPMTKPAPKRRVVEAERDPLRTKYLAYKDKNGHVRVENLMRTPTLPKAVVSDVTFRLFTVNNPSSSEYIRCEDINDLINSAYYSPSRKNYFITHGWTSDADASVGSIIRSAILSRHDANVFVVDWSGPAGEFYTEARNAVPVVGGFIGDYINQMMSVFGLSPSNFILVGHSLGAHISGAAGAAVNGLVDYIVGMDPAGPLFSLDDPGNRIDETDGGFVEIIHTNGALLGFQSAIGHADFYPNGGDWQPGCGIDITGSCSHGRSYEFMGESILTSGFRAYLCDSWNSFDSGACYGNAQSMMGEYPVNKGAFGDYYLYTNSDSPYAQG